MGSSSSRLGSTPSTSRSRRRRSSLSSLFCASSLPVEPGEHLGESLSSSSLNSAANCGNFTQQSSLAFGLGTSGSGVFTGSSSNADTILSRNPESGSLLETHVPDASSLPADAPGTSHDNQEDLIPHFHGETIGDTGLDDNTARTGSSVPSEALPGLILTVGEQGLIGMGVLLVDVVSVNPSTLPSSIAEISNREARSSRRMYLDALSRFRSSQDSDSPTVVITTSHVDGIRSHDRWLLDYSGELYNGTGHESRYSSSRSDRRRGRRWLSRYEMSERFDDVHDERDWGSSSCPMGFHSRGSCSCNSSTTEEPSSLSGISPFIMVADALFEVIEEIRRHQMSLSLSMLTLPAPEEVVDSFPLKNHKKLCGTESGTSDTLQCHICLVEYEEGDRIRVLPCSHEYHMSCVDKWLKEIHGVCPLCRDDVSKGRVEDSISTHL